MNRPIARVTAMPVNVQRRESDWSIGLEGPMTVTSAADVKNALMAWLSDGRDLELDLEKTGEVDVTVMQLLWAAAREGADRGLKLSGRISPEAAKNLSESGFLEAPGFPTFEITDETDAFAGGSNG